MKQMLLISVLSVVAFLTLGSSSAEAKELTSFEAETMQLPSSAGKVYSDSAASGGKGLFIWSNATAFKEVNISGDTQEMVVRVKAQQCEGSPQMSVAVDGSVVKRAWVWQTEFTDYVIPVNLAAGTHKIAISMGHDYAKSSCDRNLLLDKVTFNGTAVTEPTTPSEPTTPNTGDVLEGAKLYVKPWSPAKEQADKWRDTRPEDAKQMDKIATQPTANWYGEWSGDIKSAVNNTVTEASSAGAIPVLVAYNIPVRDCGGYSGGGASSASAYKTWIDNFAAGINSRKAVVILEPDALPLVDCLTTAQKEERYALLKYAVNSLGSKGATVYLDAGHPNWISTQEMINRLNKAGVEGARGFSLNVSNFIDTATNVAYGKTIASGLGKNFVIDTSRNGNGSNGEWCNPLGRALGDKPSSTTSDPAVDAYLWIKYPGESDGTCNGGPSAGTWWPEYALGLAQRS